MLPVEERRIPSLPISRLIEAFEDTDKTVKSFNQIFNQSKLTFKETAIVAIGPLHNGTQRIIWVNGLQISRELKGAAQPIKELKYEYDENGKITKESRRTSAPMPVNPTVDNSLFQLTGNVFKVYMFIKMYGPIAGAPFIEKNVDLSERAVRMILKELEEAKLIERAEVSGNTKLIKVKE